MVLGGEPLAPLHRILAGGSARDPVGIVPRIPPPLVPVEPMRGRAHADVGDVGPVGRIVPSSATLTRVVGDFVVLEAGIGQQPVRVEEVALVSLFRLFDGYSSGDPPTERSSCLNGKPI